MPARALRSLPSDRPSLDQFDNEDLAFVDQVLINLQEMSSISQGSDSPPEHSRDGVLPPVLEVELDLQAGPAPTAAGGKKAGSANGTGSAGGTGTTSTTNTPAEIHDVQTIWQALSPPVGDVALPNDTYYWKQWSLSSSTAGVNVTNAWQNYTGTGVKIGILDDGFDYNHEDLNARYLFDLDYDARDKDNDAFGLP